MMGLWTCLINSTWSFGDDRMGFRMTFERWHFPMSKTLKNGP
jgi:hypothetical protein